MEHDVVTFDYCIEPPAKFPDRALERSVLERDDIAAFGAQQMVVVLAARMGRLESCGAVANLDALHEAHLDQHIEHAVDARDTDRAAAVT